MSDGEIEVQVKADGVDDAAQELSEEGGVEAGAGGGGGEGGGLLGKSLKGGILLAALNLIVGLLGPMSGYISAVLQVLQAFLAPVSLMLMRLLMPVLRMFVKFLPRWLSWMDTAQQYLDFLSLLAELLFIGPILDALPGDIWDRFESWTANLVAAITNLPRNIGRRIASHIPGVSASEGEDIGQRAAATGPAAVSNAVVPGSGPVVQLAMSGGLDAFVESIEQSSDVDL